MRNERQTSLPLDRLRDWILAPHRLAMIIILLIALGLRLYRLGYRALDLDEIGQIQTAEQSVTTTIQLCAWHAASTPIDYLVTHATLQLGRDPSITRLPAVLWGVLAVAATYKLGSAMGSRWSGIMAAISVTTLPLMVHWSRIVRFYALPTLLFLTATLIFIKALRTKYVFWWIIYGINPVISFYAHYYTVILVSAHLIWLCLLCFAHRYSWRSMIPTSICSVGSALLFVPWVYYDNWVVGGGNPSPFTTDVFRITLPWQAEALEFLSENWTVLARGLFLVDEAPFWPTLLLTMAGFVALLVAYATHQEGLDEALLLLIGIPTLAVPLILLLHFYGQYELGARQVVFFVPYWALSWSFLPVVLRNTRTVAHSRRPIQIVVTGVVLAWLVVWVPPSLQGLAAIRRSTYVPGWAEVTRYILQVLDEDDLLLVEDPRGLWFHAPELEPRIVAYYDKAHWSQEQVTEYAQAQLSSHDTVHVIPWRPGLMDEAFREWSTAAGGSTSEHCIGAICIQHSTLSPPQSTAP